MMSVERYKGFAGAVKQRGLCPPEAFFPVPKLRLKNLHAQKLQLLIPAKQELSRQLRSQEGNRPPTFMQEEGWWSLNLTLSTL